MYKKPIFIILLLSTFTYANETNTTIISMEEIPDISVESNITLIENNISTEGNISDECNTSIIKKETIEEIPPVEKITPKGENFNMTKGDSQRGQEIFIKNLKKRCQTTSNKFATNYSQDEWEEIAESGRFREIVFKICINIRKFYQDSWSPDLYQFAYEHANDN